MNYVLGLFVLAFFSLDGADDVPEKGPQDWLIIGAQYATGKGVGGQDMLQALHWYTKALQQQVDLRSQAKANYNLGVLYENGGQGIKKDLKVARSYLEKAVEQDVSVGSREYGLLSLARIDEQEGECLRAMEICQKLARKATIFEVKNNAVRACRGLEKKCFPSDEWHKLNEDDHAVLYQRKWFEKGEPQLYFMNKVFVKESDRSEN